MTHLMTVSLCNGYSSPNGGHKLGTTYRGIFAMLNLSNYSCFVVCAPEGLCEIPKAINLSR